MFDDSITGIEDTGRAVRVRFESAPSRCSTWWSAPTASTRKFAGASSVIRLASRTSSG
jgi:hypothetical protein